MQQHVSRRRTLVLDYLFHCLGHCSPVSHEHTARLPTGCLCSPVPLLLSPLKPRSCLGAVVGHALKTAGLHLVLQYPESMATVEVGCGLEGLADAYALALQEGHAGADRQERYAAAIRTAVEFLQVRCGGRHVGVWYALHCRLLLVHG